MANPFKQNIPQAQPTAQVGNLAPLKNMMTMLNGAQNPQAALNMIAQQNPQMAQVMQLVQGRNPQEVFYEMCKQKGVNPDDILNQLR